MAETLVTLNEDERSGIFRLVPTKLSGQPGKIQAGSAEFDTASSSGPAQLVIVEQTEDFVRARVRAMGTSGPSTLVLQADSDTGEGVTRITHTFLVNAAASLAAGFGGVVAEGVNEVDPDLVPVA